MNQVIAGQSVVRQVQEDLERFTGGGNLVLELEVPDRSQALFRKYHGREIGPEDQEALTELIIGNLVPILTIYFVHWEVLDRPYVLFGAALFEEGNEVPVVLQVMATSEKRFEALVLHPDDPSTEMKGVVPLDSQHDAVGV